MIQGPPLDVVGPLRSSRKHSARSAATWIIAVTAVIVVAAPAHQLLGWPAIEEELHGEVISSTRHDDEIVVSFAAPSGSNVIAWRRYLEESSWEVGRPVTAPLDDNGRVHTDQLFGLAAGPVIVTGLLLLVLVGFSMRRLWGLQIAWWDVRSGGDTPRLGYAALIRDPAPRTVRPYLASWWDDPTTGSRLARPDAVYRADETTGEDLISEPAAVAVHRAWIDRGRFPWSKPRWVGTEEGVVIPHRRSFLGRWLVWMLIRRSETAAPAPLNHGPPDPGVPPAPEPDHVVHKHRFVSVLVWRLAAASACVAAGSWLGDAGVPTVTHSRPQEVDTAFVERARSQPRAETYEDSVPGYLAEFASRHGFVKATRTTWRDDHRFELLEWRFRTPEDAIRFADAELALWALAGRTEPGGIVGPSPDESTTVTMRVIVADRSVLRLQLLARDERLSELDSQVAELAEDGSV